MKANELMVGDWVYVKHYDGSVEPIKILNVYGNEVNCKTERNRFDIDEIVSGTYMIDLYPIPLTDEILKKNGFIKQWNGSWQFNDYHSIIISDNFYIAIFELSIRLDYVHELQHALRLAGILKEIEL